MVTFLSRYFSVVLVVSGIVAFWVFSLSDPTPTPTLSTGQVIGANIFFSVMLVSVLWLIKKRRVFWARGSWRSPNKVEFILCSVLSISVLVIDYSSKLLFFRKGWSEKEEIFKNFGFWSLFHESEFGILPSIFGLLFLILLFLIGTLFFRFSVRFLDRVWLVSGSLALGAIVSINLERLVFGGVHNSLYFSGPLRWLCPPGAMMYPSSYAWTPSDFFMTAGIFPTILVFIFSYFWRVKLPKS